MDFKRSFAPAAIGLVGLVIVAAGVYWALRATDKPNLFANPHKAGTPAFIAFEAYQKEMAGNDAFVELVRAAPDQEEAMRRGAELTQGGMQRLPDATLIERLQAMLDLMRVGDDKQCAALALGAPTDGDFDAFARVMFDLLDRADADLARRWYDFTREATLAELEKREAPANAGGYQEALGHLIVANLPPDKVSVLVAMSEQRYIGLSDAELCDVGQDVLQLILAQPDPERGRFARLMAMP